MNLSYKILQSSGREEKDNFPPFLNLIVPYIEALPLFEGIMDPTKLILSFQTMKVSEKPFRCSVNIAVLLI